MKSERTLMVACCILCVLFILVSVILEAHNSTSSISEDIVFAESIPHVDNLPQSDTSVEEIEEITMDEQALSVSDAEMLELEAAEYVEEIKLSEFVNPYANINITDDEKELLARMAYNEARGEPFEGQVAVVQVALNRYLHNAFHGSIREILLAPYQFSVGKRYEVQQMEAVEAALSGHSVLDGNTDVVYFSTGGLKYGTYYKTIGGHVFRTYQ